MRWKRRGSHREVDHLKSKIGDSGKRKGPAMIDLSIVLPTCNRSEQLAEALATIEKNTRCSFEIIVVDGASSDRTRDVLLEAGSRLGNQLRIIREPRREGFVRAANKGFIAAVGRNMTWLNDDARPLPGTLDLAMQQLDRSDDTVGFVAMFHRWNSLKNVAYEAIHENRPYRLCHVRGTLYANFPMGRRKTFESLGFFDERYYVCAADPDLSLKAWQAGLSIVPAHGAFIDHDEVDDDRRAVDSERGRKDNELLFSKWNLPPKNFERNDFDPARPCTLIQRALTAAA
jgi:GT2 family glycosyltransferase